MVTRRAAGVVAAVALGAAVLTPSGERAEADPPRDPNRLVLEPCTLVGRQAECRTLPVYEDRATTRGRMIDMVVGWAGLSRVARAEADRDSDVREIRDRATAQLAAVDEATLVKSSTATATPDPNSNTGLNAGIPRVPAVAYVAGPGTDRVHSGDGTGGPRGGGCRR